MLNHDSHLIEPRFRHASLQVVVFKNPLGSRSVNPLLCPMKGVAACHFMEQPSARQSGSSAHTLEKYGDACRSAEAPRLNPGLQLVRLLDFLQYLNDFFGLRDAAAAGRKNEKHMLDPSLCLAEFGP